MKNNIEVIEAGIMVEGDNKWITLMRNAIKTKNHQCKMR